MVEIRMYTDEKGREPKLAVLLLVSGNKSSQSDDIETAKAYWREYNA